MKISDQKGQGLLEYIILCSFIGLLCLVAIKQLGGVIEKRIHYLKSELVEKMPNT